MYVGTTSRSTLYGSACRGDHRDVSPDNTGDVTRVNADSTPRRRVTHRA